MLLLQTSGTMQCNLPGTALKVHSETAVGAKFNSPCINANRANWLLVHLWVQLVLILTYEAIFGLVLRSL